MVASGEEQREDLLTVTKDKPTDLVEVEREFAGNRAVESGFEEGGPSLLEAVRSSPVVFAHPGHPGVHDLEKARIKTPIMSMHTHGIINRG